MSTYKFLWEYDRERILKIGRYLPKLPSKSACLVIHAGIAAAVYRARSVASVCLSVCLFVFLSAL